MTGDIEICNSHYTFVCSSEIRQEPLEKWTEHSIKLYVAAFSLTEDPKSTLWTRSMVDYIARTYLQPHYGNGVFGNVYLSAGQH